MKSKDFCQRSVYELPIEYKSFLNKMPHNNNITMNLNIVMNKNIQTYGKIVVCCSSLQGCINMNNEKLIM